MNFRGDFSLLYNYSVVLIGQGWLYNEYAQFSYFLSFDQIESLSCDYYLIEDTKNQLRSPISFRQKYITNLNIYNIIISHLSISLLPLFRSNSATKITKRGEYFSSLLITILIIR